MILLFPRYAVDASLGHSHPIISLPFPVSKTLTWEDALDSFMST